MIKSKKINEIESEILQKIYKHSAYKLIDVGILFAVISGIIISVTVFSFCRERYFLGMLLVIASLVSYLIARCFALWQIVPFINLELEKEER